MNDFLHSPPTCWIVTEGLAGTENQCLGIAEALGIEPVIKRIGLNQPWKSFSPWLGFEQNWTFTEQLSGPWPDLLIASGRKSIAASRYIKKQSGGKTFTVQIQDPRISSKNFDLIAVPHHDPTRGENVIVTDASPNRITAEKLKEARAQFAPAFEPLESPRVAVLIGGTSKAHRMTEGVMSRLAQQLQNIDASYMVTASRRTDETCMRILKNALPGAYIWNGSGENPYFGMLAWADFILVTEDSASMLSEAGTTGKPVYMIEMEGGGARIDKLHAHLQTLGVIRPFEGKLVPFSYTPLKDAYKVAQEISRAIMEHVGQVEKAS